MHLIFIPIILRDHWLLVTVDMREMRIGFYDPSGPAAMAPGSARPYGSGSVTCTRDSARSGRDVHRPRSRDDYPGGQRTGGCKTGTRRWRPGTGATRMPTTGRRGQCGRYARAKLR